MHKQTEDGQIVFRLVRAPATWKVLLKICAQFPAWVERIGFISGSTLAPFAGRWIFLLAGGCIATIGIIATLWTQRT
jgi:hypothetical protein